MGNATSQHNERCSKSRHDLEATDTFEWPSLTDSYLPPSLRGTLKYLKFANGDTYLGPVNRSGEPGGGNGIILYRDGSAFVGRLENGKRCGEGTFVHAATDVQYDGGWNEDHWDGEGSLYSVHDGTVLEGIWERGELVGEGKRIDLNSGITWTERYNNGRLVSQKLVNLHSRKSSASTSSSHTSSDGESRRHSSSSDPVAVVLLPNPLQPADAVTASEERTSVASAIPWTKPVTLWRPGPICSIVGSPSFLQYCQNGELGGCFPHRASEGRVSSDFALPSPRRSSESALGLQQQQERQMTMSGVLAWTPEDVAKWLDLFGMSPAVVQAFRDHQIGGVRLLCATTRDSLKRELGIFAFGYRAKIIENLKLLKLQIRLNEERLANSSYEYEALMKVCPPPVKTKTPAPAATLAATNFHIPFEQLEFQELLGGDAEFFSATYRGRWLGKSIAIKVFTAFLIDQQAWDVYVASLLELRHPHLVLVLGVSIRHPDLHCIVMEYAPHRSLLDCLHGLKVHEHFDAWAKDVSIPPANSSSSSSTGRWFSSWPLRRATARVSAARMTITSDEAGSCMPLNQATEPKNLYDEEATLLTVGKMEYPMTTSVCPHIHPLLKLLIPLNRSQSRTTNNDDGRRSGHVFSNTALASVAKGIVLGCLYLAQRQVYHLNLKSSNVLIDESFHPKLTDFGQNRIAKAFTNAPLLAVVASGGTRRSHTSAHDTAKGSSGVLELVDLQSSRQPKEAICPNCKKSLNLSVPGGPVIEATMERPRRLQWCAPEVLRVPMKFIGDGVESDVYSFGMILWNLLAHQIPFVGLSSTHIRVAVGYAGLKPAIERIWLPLQKLVSSCLEFNPSDRPTFQQILFSLVNIHQSANTTAEDALLVFMQGQ